MFNFSTRPVAILIALAAGALAMTTSPRDAKASFGFTYGFGPGEGPPAGGWNPWIAGTHSEAVMNWDTGDYGRAGYDLLILFDAGGSTSDFALVDGEVDMPDQFYTGQTPVSCYFDLMLKSSHGAKVKLTMMDETTWATIGQKSFNMSPSTPWTNYVVFNTWACTRHMNLRIEVDGTTNVQDIHADQVTVIWNF